MIWLLDDGPFDQISTVSLATEPTDSQDLRLLVTSTTERDAETSAARKSWLGECPLAGVIRVAVGGDDPAGRHLLELHGEEKTTTNLAEREAIAWALVHEPAAVFVTMDRRATVTALAELGRKRVAHPFDLWLDLLDRRMLTLSDFEDLCERTRRNDQGLERMPARVRRRLDGLNHPIRPD